MWLMLLNVEARCRFLNITARQVTGLVFSPDERLIDKVLLHSSSGGVTVDGLVMH